MRRDAGGRSRSELPLDARWRSRHDAADARHAVGVALALLAAAAYAGWASGTRPFTDSADVAVSVPSAAFVAALAIARWRASRSAHGPPPVARPSSDGGVVPWLVVIALLVAVELASYFHSGPRADYPTISSGLDALFGNRPAKAATFYVWLVVGWFLASR